MQLPVLRPNFQETTALGAALAAGYAVGFWPLSFLQQHPANNCATFAPSVAPEDADKRFRHWSKAVARSLDLADLAD
jgi:glycerol kinase